VTIKKCGTCGADEITDESVRSWYCAPPSSKQTTIKHLCLHDALALERSGWMVRIVPTTAQRVTARQWDRAGIGAN